MTIYKRHWYSAWLLGSWRLDYIDDKVIKVSKRRWIVPFIRNKKEYIIK